MPIETLRTEISELIEQIDEWETDIGVLNANIEIARDKIREKTAEIERLEAEAVVRENLISQLTEALTSMSNDQLSDLISSLNNGSIRVNSEIDHEEPTRVLVINENDENEYEITDEMKSSYMTLVGTSHQRPWIEYRFVPEIGMKIILSKETETSNCYGLIAEELQDEYADYLDGEFVLGILPTNGSSKTEELADLGLPCKTHQDVWENPDLDATYVVTGNVPGKFITLKKCDEPATVETEEDVEESTPSTSYSELIGYAATEQEARALFNNQKNDDCQILNVRPYNGDWLIEYDNHRHNDLSQMREIVIVKHS